MAVVAGSPLIASVPDTAILVQLLGWATSSLGGQIGNEPTRRLARAGLTGGTLAVQYFRNAHLGFCMLRHVAPFFLCFARWGFAEFRALFNEMTWVLYGARSASCVWTVLRSVYPPDPGLTKGTRRRKDTYLESTWGLYVPERSTVSKQNSQRPRIICACGSGHEVFLAGEAWTPTEAILKAACFNVHIRSR